MENQEGATAGDSGRNEGGQTADEIYGGVG